MQQAVAGAGLAHGFAQVHHFAAGQHHRHGQHIVPGYAVLHGPHAAGIGGHVAAQGGGFLARVRRVHQAVGQGVRRQVAQQHTRLGMHHQVLHVIGEDFVHPLRAQHNAAVDGHAAAHQAGARATDGDRDLLPAAQLHNGGDLFRALHQAHRLRQMLAVDGHLVMGIGFLHPFPILEPLLPQQLPQLLRQGRG